MGPVIRLCKAAYEGNLEKCKAMCDAQELVLKTDEWKLTGKHLMKCIFQKWINAAEALLEMIIMKLPSPVKAQKYRAAYLYEGPQEDQSF